MRTKPTLEESTTCACQKCDYVPCPCEGGERKPRYVEIVLIGNTSSGVDALHWTCSNCGYTWTTPTADAETTK